MRSRFVLVLLLLLTTACSRQDDGAAKLDLESKSVTAAPQEPTAAEIAAAKQQADDEQRIAAELAEAARIKGEAEAAAKRLVEAKEKYAALEEQLKTDSAEFSKTIQKAKTREEFMALSEQSPTILLGPKFVEFAKTYADTEEAFLALTSTIRSQRSESDSKTEAMNLILEIIDADPDHESAHSTWSLIANTGSGEAKSQAMSNLLATTEVEPDSQAAYDTLTLLAFNRGDDDSKTKAIEKLQAMVESQSDSDRAADILARFATRGEGDRKTEAIETMIKDYVDHDKMIEVVSSLSRGAPTEQNEKWITQILENSTTSKVRGNALVAKLAVLDNINSYKGFYASADEETLADIPKETLEYVNAERDAGELKELETALETFVHDHASVLKKVESELFVLKHLSINCEAPEIAGLDLDGTAFNLSDYRGKVVLLDFWGDW